MRSPKVRPTFKLTINVPPSEALDRIRAKLPSVRGTIAAQLMKAPHVELVPHPSLVHLWSPQLRLDLVETEEGTRIMGKFSPHPHVWITYLIIHAVGALGTVGAAVLGYSQHLMGQTPWALWALPSAPILAAFVWALAFVGQGLASEQMYALRRFVEDVEGTADAVAEAI